MKVLEINFPVPTPPPGKDELHFTRCIRAGKSVNRATDAEENFEIIDDVKLRIVMVVELNSGETAKYPYECINRMRVENE